MDRVDRVVEVLMTHLDLVSEPATVDAIFRELEWPPLDSPTTVWVVDGESPTGLANKILAALDQPD